MALFEIQIVRRSGAIETRYSDRPVTVGDRITIDSRTLVVVERLPSPSDPLANMAFLCAEATGAGTANPRRARRPRETRQAA